MLVRPPAERAQTCLAGCAEAATVLKAAKLAACPVPGQCPGAAPRRYDSFDNKNLTP